MPLYEYFCPECRSRFELLLSYTESESELVCMKCHSSKVRKMFSVFAAPRRGSADEFGFGGSESEMGDFGEAGGGCSCGGSCSCQD